MWFMDLFILQRVEVGEPRASSMARLVIHTHGTPKEKAAKTLLEMYAQRLKTSGVKLEYHSSKEHADAYVRRLLDLGGTVVLLDPDSGRPRALCDGTFLTALRTGAASGAATDLLARPEARVGAVIGCGAQGRTQVLAIDCVRALDEIRVCDRKMEAAVRLAKELEEHVGARLVPVGEPSAALADADVICAATTSATPVFDGNLLVPGTHVNGVGSFTLGMRELDGATQQVSPSFFMQKSIALRHS